MRKTRRKHKKYQVCPPTGTLKIRIDYPLTTTTTIAFAVIAIFFVVASTSCIQAADAVATQTSATSSANSNNTTSKYPAKRQDFIDGNGNVYESAVINACPSAICSCLDDYFECRKQNLKKPPNLPDWVQNLDLTGNKLDDSIETEIGNLTQLITLTLKKNRLRKVPVFKNLRSLEELNLANNKIQAINSEALLSLPNLKVLDLSKNSIRTILPNSFPVRNQIESLNLNYNRLSTLTDSSLSQLRALTELQLSNNNLSSLPNGIFKSLTSLRKLFLSDNRIDINWAVFKGLENLRLLKLRSNEIRQLPDGVFHVLKSIETIYLDSNRLSHLSRQGFYNLTSLQALSLSNNSIVSIESDTWEFTQFLQYLDLSNNNLTEFKSEHLDCLQRLERLNLANNRIQHLADSTFECVKNLEQLNLSQNKLAWIIEDTSAPFKSLKKLRKLDLSSNGVKSINQKSFSGLVSLQTLNLDLNNLTTVQVNAFEPISKLDGLTLKSEHFLCDCNLQWLYAWLKNFRRDVMPEIVAVCDYPENLRGQSLLSLKETDFMCNESPKPRLIKEPSNQLAIKGTNVTLECSAMSSLPADSMHIQWRRDNVDINQNETDTELKHPLPNSYIISSYLRLFNVNHNHTGRYQCVVVNSFGTTYSQRFKITVATYPGFRKVPTNITIKSGSTARLDCSAMGEPMPQIAWQKDGGNDFPAARERRMHVAPADDAFFIVNAKPSDMGVYTCTAENPAGIITANATLVVYEYPSFVHPMESKEVQLGKSCVLECLCHGSPRPVLQWFKDNKSLDESSSDRYYLAANRQLLVIVDTKSTDTGTYKCEVKNDLSTIVGYATLTIVTAGLSRNVVNVEEMTGIIIITIFCCAIGTSIVWVVIIYQTKKTLDHNPNQTTMTAITSLNQTMAHNGEPSFSCRTRSNHHVDSVSSSGADGAPTAAASALIGATIHLHSTAGNTNDDRQYHLIMPQEMIAMNHLSSPAHPPSRCDEDNRPRYSIDYDYLIQNATTITNDHLSSKDSGTGSETIKRSLDDLTLTTVGELHPVSKVDSQLSLTSQHHQSPTLRSPTSPFPPLPPSSSQLFQNEHDDDFIDEFGDDDNGDGDSLATPRNQSLRNNIYDNCSSTPLLVNNLGKRSVILATGVGPVAASVGQIPQMASD